MQCTSERIAKKLLFSNKIANQRNSVQEHGPFRFHSTPIRWTCIFNQKSTSDYCTIKHLQVLLQTIQISYKDF